LGALVIAVAMLIMFTTMPSSPRGGQPPVGFFIAMAVFLVVFSVGWSLPSIIAGYALLKKKKWARTAGIVAGAFAAAQMPVGTAVGVYTFWFLFSPPGRLLYDPQTRSLTGGRQELGEAQYVPPDAPPDWR
jgi:hypothetical protein